MTAIYRCVTGQVREAFDPPLHGQEYDRVPREGESYVKDFKPLTVGNLDLPAGRGLLTIRASKIPGTRAIDLRMLELTLK